MHPNAELIQEGYEAFAKGDMDTIAGLFDDEITWHAKGTGPISGDYRGKTEVFGLFGKLQELTEGTFQQEIHAILGDDEHVVVLTDSQQEKPKPFSGQTAFIWHVRDGKAVECWAIPADQAAAAEAFR